ncbi:MAG: pyridoxamine 5'-phosphate oxidase [Bdellovibrionales bacterium]
MNIGPDSKPLDIFSSWMAEMKKHPGIKEASAMSLATSDGNELHSRIVLCRGWSEEGFTFFTNYQSRKGLDLAQDAQASAVFYWDPVFRQVCISGTVSKTSREVSEKYWNARARESQLSQYISHQSQAVASREELQAAWTKADQEFSGKSIPCPAHWGGYVLAPKRIEFWIGQPGRLHDRFEFEKTERVWTFRRLYP